MNQQKISAEFPTKNAFLKPILNQFTHMTHQIKVWNLLYKIKIFLYSCNHCNRSKNGKKTLTLSIFGTFLPFLSPLQPLKHY